MSMYIRLLLILALFSVVAHPSVAQVATTIPAKAFLPTLSSGFHGEGLEVVLVLLDTRTDVDGKTIVPPPEDCKFSAKFEVFDASEFHVPPVFVQEVTVFTLDQVVIFFEFARVTAEFERGQVVAKWSEISVSGLCPLLLSLTLVAANGSSIGHIFTGRFLSAKDFGMGD